MKGISNYFKNSQFFKININVSFIRSRINAVCWVEQKRPKEKGRGGKTQTTAAKIEGIRKECHLGYSKGA